MIIKKYLVLIALLWTPSVLFAVELLYDPDSSDKLNNKLNDVSELSTIRPGANLGYAKARIVGDIDINLIAGTVQKIVIQLPNQPPLIALKRQDGASKRLQKNGAIHSTWIGKLHKQQNSSVVISTFRGTISGRISFQSKIYEIKRNNAKDLAAGAYVIEEINTEALPECEAGANPINGGQDSKQSSLLKNNIPEPSHDAAGEEVHALVSIDLLAVYTAAARIRLGGTSGIQAHIIAAMDNANVAYVNSGMEVQFNMAHMEEVSHTESDGSTDLTWVRNDSAVAALRNTHNADMVSLITDSDYCGIGYVQRTPGSSFSSLAFQVTDVDCAVGNLTFAHEHGHNMGMEHDPANGTSPTNASYPYSFGHFVNGSYRSVMSYSNQCTSGCSRAMYFSNPDVSYLGAATGIANQRHNALTGINTAPIVAAFRSGGASNPDLVVQSPAVSDASLEPSESFTTSATTRNQGTGTSNPTTLRYYVSTDSIISTGDILLGTDSVSGLIAGGTETDSEIQTAPTAHGTYWVGACVDSVTGESDTSNNCSTGVQIVVLVASGPDLIVQSPAVSDDSLESGQTFTTSATTRNQGTDSANATTLRYYVSTDSIISTGDTLLGTDSVSGLIAGGTENDSGTHTSPTAGGAYWVGACVDSVTDESNTSNNCSVGVPIGVSYMTDAYEPDNDSSTAKPIARSETQLHSFHVAGDKDWITFTLTETVKNFKLETSYPDSFGDTRLYLYDNQIKEITFDDDGGINQFSLIELPMLHAGTYFILVNEFGDDDVLDAYNLQMNFEVEDVNADDILDYLPAILAATRTSLPGSSCGDKLIYDCIKQCVSAANVDAWIGDGHCDDDRYGIDLACTAFDIDAGDCD